MIERLEQITSRYNEIKEKLSTNEVIQDIKKTLELSKELSSLEEIVNTYKEYKTVLDGIKDAKEMVNDKTRLDIFNIEGLFLNFLIEKCFYLF